MTRSRLAVLAATAMAAGLLPALSITGSAAAAPITLRAASDADDIFTTLPGFEPDGDRVRVEASDFAAVRVDLGAARRALAGAPQRVAKRGEVFELPTPDGDTERFSVHRTTVMEPELAAAHPELRTYAGQSLDTPGRSVALDITPLGLHASVRGPGGDYLVDPAYDGRGTTEHVSYYTKDATTPVPDLLEQEEPRDISARVATRAADDEAGEPVTRRTYRIAIGNDPSYAAYFGTENVMAEKVTLMTRVNQVYNDDLGIRMVLINDSEDLNFDTEAKAQGPDGPCGAAPCFDPPVGDPESDDYEPGMLEYCSPGALGRMRTVLGQVVGADAYDLGHLVLGVNGGGVAYLGVVGQDYSSGGCTGLPEPRGDFFAIDYVAHEIGHQFAGNHTFNGTKGACGGNIADASVEPGSGSSVMAYAGICGTDDLQPHTDPYFSQLTVAEVTSFVTERVRSAYEVQTVSLRGFDSPGDSFDISFGDETRTLTRGENYNRPGVEAAVEEVTGVNVRIARWGYDAYSDFSQAIANPGVPSDAGFQVIFNDELDPFGGGTGTRKNYTSLAVTGAGDVTGFVGETAKGGPASNRGDQVAVTANHKPVVDAGKNRVIPTQTPFELKGSATDADADQDLTYLWEQNNTGLGTALTNNRKRFGPLFRVFSDNAVVTDEAALLSPSPGQNSAGSSATRSFPDLAQVLRGVTNAKTGTCPTPRIDTEAEETAGEPILTDDELDCFSEFLPTRDYQGTGSDRGRKLVFRLTARDGFTEGGGSSYDDVKLRLKKKAGPFLVKNFDDGETIKGGKKVRIAWDVNRTKSLAKKVRIKLSTDNGETWSNVERKTANDGAVRVKIPDVTAEKAWFKIEARGNIFYDVNDQAFSIE
ncbi:hypothetical protein BKA08_001828 [Nocardioides marinisabuli]|uniref:Reprolysin-like metallo-peptidase family M12B n=1 Tax=Nocardioides marinisabuli TaxID=419476 RepID=A0A7Y9F2M4_9ACTN|nr:M12 family metallo-peptidase [Nocardioides marinisabuli]NYD57590.1 hypothetical protein [Nocardioides marinisabuli]